MRGRLRRNRWHRAWRWRLGVALALLALAWMLAPEGIGRGVVVGQSPVIQTLRSGDLFLPPYTSPRDRFGFDVAGGSPAQFDVARLGAGWYSDWSARLQPSQPAGLTYAQLVRLQAGADPTNPNQVTWTPTSAEIARIARAHPGALWMIGNEPDSFYQGAPILPQTYAHVYHRLWREIKALDPLALVAIGAIVQPTPCRLQYLDIVLDTYQAAYGAPMPVDLWNIHAFMLREVYGSWGASTPPGVDPSCGIAYAIRDADSITILRANLRAFRQWMLNRQQGDKPLIISEYGILWPEWLIDERGRGFPPDRVITYMRRTFDLFLNEQDASLGWAQDGGRLVQAWAWYSLADDQQYNGHLFSSQSKEISTMGQAYADDVAALVDAPRPDAAVQLWVDTRPLEGLGPRPPGTEVSVTLPVTVAVTNLGRAGAPGVWVECPSLGYGVLVDLAPRYEAGSTLTLAQLDFVINEAGEYVLQCVADPQQLLDDPRRANNISRATIDARHLHETNYSIWLPLLRSP